MQTKKIAVSWEMLIFNIEQLDSDGYKFYKIETVDECFVITAMDKAPNLLSNETSSGFDQVKKIATSLNILLSTIKQLDEECYIFIQIEKVDDCFVIQASGRRKSQRLFENDLSTEDEEDVPQPIYTQDLEDRFNQFIDEMRSIDIVVHYDSLDCIDDNNFYLYTGKEKSNDRELLAHIKGYFDDYQIKTIVKNLSVRLRYLNRELLEEIADEFDSISGNFYTEHPSKRAIYEFEEIMYLDDVFLILESFVRGIIRVKVNS